MAPKAPGTAFAAGKCARSVPEGLFGLLFRLRKALRPSGAPRAVPRRSRLPSSAKREAKRGGARSSEASQRAAVPPPTGTPLCVCMRVYVCVCAHLFPTLQTPLFRDAQRLCPERPFRTASGSRVRSQQRETGKPLHFVPERRAWSAVRNGRVSPRAVGRRSGSVPQVTLTSGLRLGARSSCADSEPLKGRSK